MIHLHTNDWDDLGENRIRRWAVAGDFEKGVPPEIAGKRPIDVEISSWVGTSIGAKHTYVEVTERDNEW